MEITKDITTMTELELRDFKVPFFDTKEQLEEFINSLLTRKHDYGTCVYAMSLAAHAAFNYVAHKLGVSSFQASCADLDFLKRSRDMEGPFKIMDLARALYPQYDLTKETLDFVNSKESRKWLKGRAIDLLTEKMDAHPSVIAHWKKLAE